MINYLAIDAGGTSTRAVFLSARGECLGYGISGGGNPVSRGFEGAIDSLLEASEKALGGTGNRFHSVTLGMAGASLELPTHLFQQRFITLGLAHEVLIESDLLAAFYSGTYQDNGYALIAGTGAVAARVTESRLAAVADGTGWLLGDDGAGFWLGSQVVRAVAAALDGRGAPTALTELVLAELDITLDPGVRTQGRVGAQQQLIVKIYEMRPIELSRFAPMVFAVRDDAVAADIIERAADALARTLGAVIEADTPGPLVFGGSVLTKGGAVAAAVTARLADKLGAAAGSEPLAPVLVHDGVVGAAVLALKRNGVEVDAAVFGRITESLAALRD
ncbi:N-acetylglucosamine kinase [Arthrobacter sp. ERGS1:01]|uniref:N-acetylglucosamine kinase n=1 Tax=Arthrobacter sp. ERGS1:01 TaxID=1704044 RepID=UPI000A99EE74|nr:BadF/BadG/BcrA/BcrD ATPase family protein [Arthrobacter sp. ERGS1:01]